MKRRIGMLVAACFCILFSVGAFCAGRDMVIPSKTDMTNRVLVTDTEKQTELPSEHEEEKNTETQEPNSLKRLPDQGTEKKEKQRTEETEIASKPDTEQPDKISVQSVQTGDDTPILFFCLLFACSAGILMIKRGILNGRKKRDGTGNSAGKLFF